MRDARDRARRGNSGERGYDRHHRAWRAAVLARDPLCRDPFGFHAERRERVASTVADHILPLRHGGTWSIENGAGLCVSCHARKTNLERRDPELGRRLLLGG